MSRDVISVVIPAYNEERYLPATLNAVARSAAILKSRHGVHTELIVVDNGSTDATAQVARAAGARVIAEPRRNIARVRNCGAAAAAGDVLVFVDADTCMPGDLLPRIHEVVSPRGCVGGAVDTDYRAQKRIVRVYLGFWRIVGRLAGMAQGATQFCRREAFAALGGFDESLFMGEDVDFYSRLRKHARRDGGHVSFIHDLQVQPSTRRFDQWPIWRTLLWTNPLVIIALRRARSAWRGWYDAPVR